MAQGRAARVDVLLTDGLSSGGAGQLRVRLQLLDDDVVRREFVFTQFDRLLPAAVTGWVVDAALPSANLFVGSFSYDERHPWAG